MWDGRTNLSIAVDAATDSAAISGGAGWGTQRFAVTPPAGRNLSWSFDASAAAVARNGLVAPIVVETPVGTDDPTLTLTLAPTAV